MTSFRRDGTGVATPVWFVSDGRRLFALTDLHSAKVRRMGRNPHVLIASCRADGKLRGEPVPARTRFRSRLELAVRAVTTRTSALREPRKAAGRRPSLSHLLLPLR